MAVHPTDTNDMLPPANGNDALDGFHISADIEGWDLLKTGYP
jgi:hypothetical protein